MQPVVTVCVLAYNHEPYIRDALEGILTQRTSFPVEILVGEDCSTDGTLSAIERYAHTHAHVRVISGPQNVGMIRNFLRLIEAARGDYVAICEGDDWWIDPDKLQKQVDMMRADPSLGLVHANLRTASKVNGSWELSRAPVHAHEDRLSGYVFGPLQRDLFVKTCTVLYRREVMQSYATSRFANPDHVAADFPLALMCAAHWKIGYLPDIVGVYRHSANSATRSGHASMARFLAGVLRIYADVEREFGARPDYDPTAKQWVWRALCLAAFRAGDAQTFRLAYANVRRPSRGLMARNAIASAPPLHRIANMILDKRGR